MSRLRLNERKGNENIGKESIEAHLWWQEKKTVWIANFKRR